MTAAEHTRIVLTEFKRLGTPFKTAWANAMRTLPRKQPEYKEWKDALRWARPAFEACYNEWTWEVLSTDEKTSELVSVAPQQTVDALLALDPALV